MATINEDLLESQYASTAKLTNNEEQAKSCKDNVTENTNNSITPQAEKLLKAYTAFTSAPSNHLK